MKRILMGKKKIMMLMDDISFAKFGKFRWYLNSSGYAIRKVSYGKKGNRYEKPRKVISLHREIMNCPEGMEVDHINGNRLDNRKSNLRICTRKENGRNRMPSKNNTTGTVGVRYFKEGIKRWMAFIHVGNKTIGSEMKRTKEEAIRARFELEKKYFKSFAPHKNRIAYGKI